MADENEIMEQSIDPDMDVITIDDLDQKTTLLESDKLLVRDSSGQDYKLPGNAITTPAKLNDKLQEYYTKTETNSSFQPKGNYATKEELTPLASKEFVNSSVATNTAYFIDTFNSVEELEAYTGAVTNNDYAFVIGTDDDGNTIYKRYKYNANNEEWQFEYILNNSSFTAEQWATIQSGITAESLAAALATKINKSDFILDGDTLTINL